MLDQATQIEILETVEERWSERSEAGDLAPYMLRREVGHGLADFVEDVTVNMLQRQFRGHTAFQHGGSGPRARSMGDIWIESGGVFNPLNIKTGVKDPDKRSGGQPNLVSLAKLTEAVLRRWIDSYYLLLIRFVRGDPPAPAVSLVDLLHIAKDYTHFDAGTGQLMLRAAKFDDPPDVRYTPADPREALDHLLSVREDGNRRLAAKRHTDLLELRRAAAGFDASVPMDQAELKLDPTR